MAADPLKDFYLVGGTALALHYGHRLSVDIDLFTDQPFDSTQVGAYLTAELGLTESTIEENTVLGRVEGTKLDCLAHQYPMVAGS